MTKYISKGDWFDKDTESILIDDYRPLINGGLFCGLVNGKKDEEVCSFEEFTIEEE